MRLIFRILVTASRTWPDDGSVQIALDRALVAAQEQGYREVMIIEGACPTGGDKYAHAWAVEGGHRWKRYRAHWGTYGRSAGFKRNSLMVQQGADMCIAFIAPCNDNRCTKSKPHGSHGATDCARLAKAAGIPTLKVILDD